MSYKVKNRVRQKSFRWEYIGIWEEKTRQEQYEDFFCCSRYMNGAVCRIDWYHSVRGRRIFFSKITQVHKTVEKLQPHYYLEIDNFLFCKWCL